MYVMEQLRLTPKYVIGPPSRFGAIPGGTGGGPEENDVLLTSVEKMRKLLTKF